MSTTGPEGDDEPVVRRDRREHGGVPAHPDDDALARRTEQERVDADLDDYDPDAVPPATDEPDEFDVTATEEYQEAEAEVEREEYEGELRPLTDEHPYPPTRYDRS